MMNPRIPQRVIDEAMERDPPARKPNIWREFRTDVESFIAREAVEACVSVGVRERRAATKHKLCCFL